MDPDLKAAIDKFISENKVVVFMKGHKDAPKCGFSNTVCQVITTAIYMNFTLALPLWQLVTSSSTHPAA